MISPFNCKMSLKTPCAAGCCGPKFKFIVFIVLSAVVFVLTIGFQFWKILLFRIYLFPILNFFFEKSFALFFLTIFTYCLCLCVFFFILFFLKRGKACSLTSLNSLNNLFFFKFVLICVLLALAGLPPFFSFFLKSFFFLFFLKKGFFFVSLFLIFNLLSMFFYIQIVRLLLKSAIKNTSQIFLSKISFKFRFFFFLECTLIFLLAGFFFMSHFLILLLALFL